MARPVLHRARDTVLGIGGVGLAFYELALSPEPRVLLVAAGIALITIPVNAHVNRLMDVPTAEPANAPGDTEETDPLADLCCDMGRIAWPAPCPWHTGNQARTVVAHDPPSMVIVAAGRHLDVPAVGPIARSDLVIVRRGTPSLFLNVPADLDAGQRAIDCDDVLARLDLPANTVAIRQSMIVGFSDERAGQSG